MRFCPRCWQEVEEGQEYCAACGGALDLGPEDLVAKYIAAMRHREPTRAALAIQVLSEMLQESRAIPPLIALLETANDAFVVRAAVEALGRFADPRAVAPLGRLLLNPETPLIVRIAAAQALGDIGGKEAQAVLKLARTDASASVREQAQRMECMRKEQNAPGCTDNSGSRPARA